MNKADILERRSRLSPAKLTLLGKRLRGELTGERLLPALPQRLDQYPPPLSFAQQRLWFIHQMEPDSADYNIHHAIRLTGVINLSALGQALNEIVRRHEVLRTAFTTVRGQPVQVISPNHLLAMQAVDLRGLSLVEREGQSLRLAAREAKRPFDLTRLPLLRTTFLEFGEDEYLIFLTMHHIVSDAWSFGVLVRELVALYGSFSDGLVSSLPVLANQYADFACWQRQWLESEAFQIQLSYWKRQLDGTLPILQLPDRRPRSEVNTIHGAMHSVVIPADVTESLKTLSREEDVSLFMTFLAALQTLLHRCTGLNDIAVGADIANRNQIETEAMIGFFVNILVLRTNLRGNPTFRELLPRVREVVVGAYANQDMPFERIVEELRPERSASHMPLVHILLVFQNAPVPILRLPGLTLSSLELDGEASRFELALFVEESQQGVLLTWRYNSDLFDAAVIVQMADHFRSLLSSIIARPDTRVSDLEILTDAEKKRRSMEKSARKQANLEKFMRVAPKTVSFRQDALVKTSCLVEGQGLPLVMQPAVEDIDLIEFVSSNRAQIESRLFEHGAILFRNFQISSLTEFEQLSLAICPQLFGDYGDLKREEFGRFVYSSTPYPTDQAILYHNESSHMHRWPLKQFFFCAKAATQGGETPIVDCRRVYRMLNRGIRERLKEKSLMYVRNFIDGLDVSWQEFFGTSDPAALEQYCRSAGIEFEWIEQKGLRTRQIRRAVSRHPKTKEELFFNQLQLHHPSCLDPGLKASLKAMFGEDELPRNVRYGDGEPIEDEVVDAIRGVYRELAVSFPWEEGDVLMLDNMLTAHGRNPYVGQRKIVVAMGEMIREQDI